MGIAIGALTSRMAGKQLHASRASAKEALDKRIARSTLQWEGHYTDHNVDTLDAMLDGRPPTPDPELVAAHEAREYTRIAASFGLGPNAHPAAVLEGIKVGLEQPGVSPLGQPIQLPALNNLRI
jgi:hypothetical protein